MLFPCHPCLHAHTTDGSVYISNVGPHVLAGLVAKGAGCLHETNCQGLQCPQGPLQRVQPLLGPGSQEPASSARRAPLKARANAEGCARAFVKLQEPYSLSPVTLHLQVKTSAMALTPPPFSTYIVTSCSAALLTSDLHVVVSAGKVGDRECQTWERIGC
jgi:hypothetical protein